MSSDQSDYAIIQTCLKGDPDAFSDLVTRYRELVYGITWRMTGNAEDADDLAQDAFLKLFQSLSRYQPQYAFSTWAVKITTNLCLDWKRRHTVQTRAMTQYQQEVELHTPAPEPETTEADLYQQVAAAVSALPEKYQHPLILFHQLGLGYQQITEQLGEPLSIIKNRLLRARKMLSDQLSNQRKAGLL